MKKFLLVCVLVLASLGCTEKEWGEFEQKMEKVEDGAEKGSEIGGVLGHLVGPYGGLLVGVPSIVAAAAAMLKKFAAEKKQRAIAKAAVVAADAKPGGGSDLNTAAALMNVGPEIREAYEKSKTEK